jgi:hypothetical protein
MVNEKMCITVGARRVMCRIDPQLHEAAIRRKGARTMTMKGREYKGYVHVDEHAITSKRELDYWIGLCLDFNRRAKSSGRRKKK